MRAWLIDGMDGIDRLRLGEVPDPTPGPGEAVLRVRYAALNPADAYLAAGQYPAKPALPHILGRDGVGEVVAVGDGVRDLKPGDVRIILRCEVGVNLPGTLAELVAVPAESLAPVPGGWGEELAGGAPLVFLTAWQALTQWTDPPAPPESGTTVLVSGASGGVGVATVLLGKALGLRIFGLSRSATKAGVLVGLGAEKVLDPTDKGWRKALLAHLAGGRIDLAVDNIGGAEFNDLLATLGQYGKVSTVGRLAGPVPEFNTAALFQRRARIGGVFVSDYTAAESQGVWSEVVARLGEARPLVDHVFPFGDVPAAFARLAEGPMGKVVVAV
jgi:NADPH2:quinone reductase